MDALVCELHRTLSTSNVQVCNERSRTIRTLKSILERKGDSIMIAEKIT